MGKKTVKENISHWIEAFVGSQDTQVSPGLPAYVNVNKQVQEFINYSEFKQLVDSIYDLQTQKKLKSIAILSELSLEGKSFFSGSLAVAFSRFLKRKVLVVDTSVFTNKGALSIEEILEPDHSRIKKNGIMPTLFAGVDFLKLTPAASSEAVEYDIDRVIAENAAKVDLIIFDTSALAQKNKGNVDPLVVARRVNGSIFLISPKAKALGALNTLDKAVAQGSLTLLGVVENLGYKGVGV